MLQNRCAILLAILVSALFASTSLAQTTLRYQFKEKETLNYVMEQKMKMVMNIMGMDVETKMDMTLDMAWNILKVESNGDARVQIKVTQAKISMTGPMGLVEVDSKDDKVLDDPVGKIFSQLAKAIGTMEITGTMQVTGDMKDMKVSEETMKALKSIPGADKMGDAMNPESFKTMVSSFTLPKEAVTKGKTWSNKVESKTPIGKTIADNTYTFEGTTEKDGVTLEKISVKPVIKIEADPNAQIKVEITKAEGNGTVLFDNKAGRLVESGGTQRTEMTIAVGGMTFNQVVDQTITMRMKKK